MRTDVLKPHLGHRFNPRPYDRSGSYRRPVSRYAEAERVGKVPMWMVVLIGAAFSVGGWALALGAVHLMVRMVSGG